MNNGYSTTISMSKIDRRPADGSQRPCARVTASHGRNFVDRDRSATGSTSCSVQKCRFFKRTRSYPPPPSQTNIVRLKQNANKWRRPLRGKMTLTVEYSEMRCKEGRTFQNNRHKKRALHWVIPARIFQNIFIDPIVSARKKAEKRERERKKETFRRQRHHQSDGLMMALTPKRLFLSFSLSLHVYLSSPPFFSRSLLG